MLILSRKKNEIICIGDNITVMVVDIFEDKVRLGITAPNDIEVDRLEVRESKRNARHLAGDGDLDTVPAPETETKP